MKKNNTINMKNLMEEINSASKLLKSSYLFEDFNEDPRMAEQQSMDNQMMNGQPQDGEMGMEEEPQVSEETVDTINQIRELAIQGIAQYANDVESEEYQALKKIWLLTDKFYEGMQEDDDKKKSF